MKVFLLNPPAPEKVKMVREGRCMQRAGAWTAVWPPISLATMAAMLKKAGFEVRVLDAITRQVDFDRLTQILKEEKPKLLVINTATPSIKGDLAVADLAKKAVPGIKTVVFGIHVSTLPRESFELSSGLDFLLEGEPELTLLALAKGIAKGGKLVDIGGLWRRQGKRILRPTSPAVRVDQDQLPYPAWEEIAIKDYLLPFTNRPFLLVNTGRGCSRRCNFCNAARYYGHQPHWPTPKRVVDELVNDIERFGVRDFLFWTESFTANRAFSLAVCDEIIWRGLKIRWVCNSRVDTVDLEQLKKFKQAGAWMIGFGIESGDERILKLMNKRATVIQARRAVALAKKAGLEVTAHLILGYPGETVETVRKTIRLAIDLDLDFAQFYTCVPFPGSTVYELAKKKSYLVATDWSLFEQNHAIMNLPGLPAQTLLKLRKQAYRQFYLRPNYFIKNLRRIRSWREIRRLLGMVRDFLTWF